MGGSSNAPDDPNSILMISWRPGLAVVAGRLGTTALANVEPLGR